MLTAIASLQTRLRAVFRPYFRDGDPQSGLNEPDLESIRTTFGTDLINILARGIYGALGQTYPELPTPAAWNGKIIALNLSGPSPSWSLIDAARVAQAADLVDFEGTIDSEIAAAVASIIAGISDDAPFNERFADEATLLADLAYPAGAYAIDMETLVIYRKTGASGSGAWVVHSNILDAFPGTASAADITEVNERVDEAEAEIDLIKKRLNRLDAAVPPIAPIWKPFPLVLVDETTTGNVRDLAAYVTDPDSPAANLTFEIVGAALTGFSISGRYLVKSTTSGVLARTSRTLRVTDESGNQVTTTMQVEVYPEGDPPVAPPVWTALPPIVVPTGNPYSLDLSIYLSDSDTDLADIEVTLTPPVEGVTINPTTKVLSFVAGGPGYVPFTLSAEDLDGNITTIDHGFTITASAAPVISLLPGRFGQVFGSPITLDLNAYVTDANTPLSELGTSLTFDNAPAGTTKGGTNNLVLTIPVNAATQRVVSVTVENRAGLTATRSFDLTIIPFNPGTGGGGGGGDIRLDPY